MNALVTGGGGFLGRYLVKGLLEQSRRVRILGRSAQPDLSKMGVETVQTDLGNRDAVVRACEGIDVVFHCGALAGIWGRWEDYFSTNVLGTRNVLDGCRIHGVNKLIYTSSPSVVFNGGDISGGDESLPYSEHWLCAYSQTKAMAEQEVLGAHETDGLLTISLRPHLIWGVGDNHLVPRVVARARDGKLRRVGKGRNKVDMVHVKNAAFAHFCAEKALITDSSTGGRAYFITDGKPVLLWEWINHLLARLGIPPVEKQISREAAYRIGSIMEGIYRVLHLKGEPRMTRFLANELATDHYFDISAAGKFLRYQPIVTMEEGMEELVAHLKSSQLKV